MDYRESPYLIEIFDFDLLHLQLNTPLFITLLVLVVLWLLNRLWFAPVLRSLDARGLLLKGWGESAERDTAESEKMLADYERRLSEVKQQLDAMRGEGLRAAEQMAEQVIAKAREAAERELAEARAEVKQQVAEVERALPQQVQWLSEQVSKRLLS